MSILVDHRAGSEELVCHAPFNICPRCQSPITINRKPRDPKRPHVNPRIDSIHCSVNRSHRLLGTLTQLARINPSPSGSPTSPDVYFTGNGPDGKLSIAIEIASFTDLMSKIQTGRLAAVQIPDLLRYDRPWIAWYGSVRDHEGCLQYQRYNRERHSHEWVDYSPSDYHRDRDKSSPKPRKQQFTLSYLENFLDSPHLTETHIRVKHYRTLADIAYWIGSCYYPLWQKPYTAHRSLDRFDDSRRIPNGHLLPTIDEFTRQLMIYAASNPSIEFTRALSVARHFDSALDMFNADVDEWANIKIKSKTGRETRIGTGRAQSIVNAIRQRRSRR